MHYLWYRFNKTGWCDFPRHYKTLRAAEMAIKDLRVKGMFFTITNSLEKPKS